MNEIEMMWFEIIAIIVCIIALVVFCIIDFIQLRQKRLDLEERERRILKYELEHDLGEKVNQKLVEWATKELTESKGAPLDLDPNQCPYPHEPNDYEFEEDKKRRIKMNTLEEYIINEVQTLKEENEKLKKSSDFYKTEYKSVEALKARIRDLEGAIRYLSPMYEGNMLKIEEKTMSYYSPYFNVFVEFIEGKNEKELKKEELE